MGDSIPRRAGERAQERGIPDLKLPASIAWWGIGGLTWSGLRRSVESQVLLCTPPKIIALHLGGNDLARAPCTAITNQISKEIRYLRAAFPQTVLIWINILDRVNWRTNHFTRKTINSKRKRINRHGASWVKSTGPSDTLVIDIDASTPGVFLADGVHLSEVGLKFYLDALKDSLSKHW